jgi:hypothetical protein
LKTYGKSVILFSILYSQEKKSIEYNIKTESLVDYCTNPTRSTANEEAAAAETTTTTTTTTATGRTSDTSYSAMNKHATAT